MNELDPISALGALIGSALLGVVKKHTSALDGRIGSAIKPLQPLLVYAAGLGLPLAANALGIAPIDPAAFVTAPATTLALVSLREGYERATGRKRRN